LFLFLQLLSFQPCAKPQDWDDSHYHYSSNYNNKKDHPVRRQQSNRVHLPEALTDSCLSLTCAPYSSRSAHPPQRGITATAKTKQQNY
jgi:hypothetical protein